MKITYQGGGVVAVAENLSEAKLLIGMSEAPKSNGHRSYRKECKECHLKFKSPMMHFTRTHGGKNWSTKSKN